MAASSCCSSIGASAADGTVADAFADARRGFTVEDGSPTFAGLRARFVITLDRIVEGPG